MILRYYNSRRSQLSAGRLCSDEVISHVGVTHHFALCYVSYIKRFVTHVNVFHKVKNRKCGMVTYQLSSERPTVEFSFK